MSKFESLLDEIESCRKAGFVKPALFVAVSLPDICGEYLACEEKIWPQQKKDRTKMKYVTWYKRYIAPNIQNLVLSAEDAYGVRNRLVHGANMSSSRYSMPVLFDCSELASRPFPPIITTVGMSMYKIVNAGVVIQGIVNAARQFYNERSVTNLEKRQRFLDDFDRYVFSNNCMENLSLYTIDGIEIAQKNPKRGEYIK